MDTKMQAYEFIDKHRDGMLRLWEKMVNVDSGPGCKEGVDQVGRLLADCFAEFGGKNRFYEFKDAGNMLVSEFGNCSEPFIILTGHMDTVFKAGTVSERPFKIEGDKAYGPGVLDMKGGIVILTYALKALKAAGWDTHPVKIILHGDEEVGHTYSSAAEKTLDEAKGAFAAFNFETGFLDNGIVVERKGMYQFQLEVFGKGAHVGNDPENGRSAIREMAYKILDIENLTDWNKGNTFNVGVITGGTVCNATPAYCKILCDMRYNDASYLPGVRQQLQAIADKTYIDGTTTKLTETLAFSPMRRLESTMNLFEFVKATAAEEGFGTLTPKAVGGASDSGYTTAAGVPTCCAMGVQGARNHTVEEFAVVESLFERAKLMIALLAKIKTN
ncbi:MAG: M20 family metallopeptidase [Acidaminococcaceae bacterium]|nr:M20 family metallopeptidase [Acidaminococcaceae bacterium]